MKELKGVLGSLMLCNAPSLPTRQTRAPRSGGATAGRWACVTLLKLKPYTPNQTCREVGVEALEAITVSATTMMAQAAGERG